MNRLHAQGSRETRVKSFSYFAEDERKRLAMKMEGLTTAFCWSRKMIALKIVLALFGAGVLLSLFFSTFGTEEAFVLLAALFA